MAPRTEAKQRPGGKPGRAKGPRIGVSRPDRNSSVEERAPRIIRRLKRAFPDARIALKFSNPLEILVATILSAQNTDERVNQLTQGRNGLFAKYRSCQDYLGVPEAELAADIRSTGYFNQKTRAIRGACQKIVEEYGGEVPKRIAELVTLPGVARKTANIVQGNAHPQLHRKDPDAGIAVDTHVRRVAQRLGFTKEHDPDKIERDLKRIIPRKAWFSFTYVLIEHGRRVCRAPTPSCEVCPVNDLCPSSRV